MTDAIKAASTATTAVASALNKASSTTGVGFDYLYRVAMRESSLNPKAQARTSSAAGLFQFIEQTWLAAVKKYGPAHGLTREAADITTGPGGRFVVADAARRKEILDLRFDPDKAAALAGELALENRKALEAGLGRAVDAAELYAAHFLGPAGARKLLSARADESAAALLPAAAKANAPVFFDGGRERTVGEVIASFRKTIGGATEAIGDFSARLEKSFAPVLREGAAAFARLPIERAAVSPASFEVKGLSPLVLAVLQALDPRALIGGDETAGRDDPRRRF